MAKAKNIRSVFTYLYWFLPLALIVLQAFFTLNSLNQIRYEEIEESISNPFWVGNHLVANGASGNIGWHFLLAFIYNLLGFGIFYGKFVKLAMWAVSLFCLASILKKFLSGKAWLPLIVIGLSPTILYFNTMQTVYGIDLVYLPICLLLLLTISFDRSVWDYLKQFIFWATTMVAFASYPTFIYFLPAFCALYIFNLRRSCKRSSFSFIFLHLLFSFAAFILPLVAAFLYITNRSLLIYDPNVQSGMFRGAGMIQFSLDLFLNNLKLNLQNLFLRSFGYYFEVAKVDFSDFYPIGTIIFIFFAVGKLWRRNRKLRLPIMAVLSILILNILLAYFTIDPTPGMRRQTGTLAAIYIFFVFSWYYVVNLPKKFKFKWFYALICLLVLLHHLVAYPINLSHAGDLSVYREKLWFGRSGDPTEAFKQYLLGVQQDDLKFMCQAATGEPINCSYSGPYAAVSGACLWNRLSCHAIYGYDLKTKSYIMLSINLFNSYYFGRYGKEIIPL